MLKTRLLLKKASAGRFIGGFLILDIAISILIPTSISVYGSMRNALIYSHYDLWHAALGVPGELYEVFWEGVLPLFTHRSTGFPLLGVLISSTLMTSIWIAATWLAIILLRGILPLQRFINWFFPVNEHPIRALGFLAGLVVFLTLRAATDKAPKASRILSPRPGRPIRGHQTICSKSYAKRPGVGT